MGKTDALIVALAKKKISGMKPKKSDDYKIVARDLIAAMKTGDESKLASVLRAFHDIARSVDDDQEDE
jgi:hypothetical protein